MTQIEPTTDTEPSFAETWEALAPGERANKGTYSVYKTHEASLLISYRPDGTPEGAPDQHLEIPAPIIVMLAAAADGKLSKVDALQMLMKLRGGLGGFGG